MHLAEIIIVYHAKGDSTMNNEFHDVIVICYTMKLISIREEICAFLMLEIYFLRKILTYSEFTTNIRKRTLYRIISKYSGQYKKTRRL